jgi:hypothetical protein
MSPVWTMPDGSRWVIPDDEHVTVPTAPNGRLAAPHIQGPTATNMVRQFLREIGRRGGEARAARHSRDEIAAWGRVRHKNGATG